jgi:hypothetical protein
MLEQLDTAIGFVTVLLLLSLTITVVVQAIASLLDLRGRNLVWALANLFQQISPEANNQGKSRKLLPARMTTVAKELAKAVATHSALASTGLLGVYKAKAIRPDELMAVLQKLAANPDALSDGAKQVLTTLLTNRLPGNNENTASMQALATEFTKRFPVQQVTLHDALMDIAGSTTRIAAGLDQWFKTVMDRAADRFARNCKFWTVVGAVVLAFGFHINALHVYRQIASDPATRAKLVAASDSVMQRAEKTMTTLGSKALNTLAADSALSKEQQDALKTAPSDLADCAHARYWMMSQDALKNDQRLFGQLDVACTAAAKGQLTAVSPDLSAINGQLANADLHLFKDFSFKHVPEPFNGVTVTVAQQLGGELLTVLLLSLGAPFWYNTLRQLSNLKSSVSRKVDNEAQAKGSTDQKQKQADATASGG